MIEPITFKGIEFKVEFDYQPAERAERDYPGCTESIDLIDIFHEGVSFFDIMEPYFEKIEELVIKELNHA